MITWVHIPGYSNVGFYQTLQAEVQKLPVKANILEVGAFFGKSTRAILEVLGSKQRLDVVDTWDDEWFKNLDDVAEKMQGYPALIDRTLLIANTESFYAAWRSNVSSLKNFKRCKSYKYTSLDHPKTDYDLVILDGNHLYENVIAELNKFSSVPTIIVDDYGLDDQIPYSQVTQAVTDYVKESGAELEENYPCRYCIIRNKI